MFNYRIHKAKERPLFGNTIFDAHCIPSALYKQYELLLFSQSGGAIS